MKLYTNIFLKCISKQRCKYIVILFKKYEMQRVVKIIIILYYYYNGIQRFYDV